MGISAPGGHPSYNMSDPLKLLREYTISGKPVKEKDEYIVFGDMAFPRTAKTNYLVWNKKDEYYTLESLYFFYKKRALQHTAYVKEAAEKKIQIVTRADRKALEDYLIKEKLDKLPTSIDLSAPVPTSIHVSKIQTESEQNDAKRPRLDFDDSVSRKPSERVLAMLEGTSSIAQSAKPDAIRDLSKEHGLTKDKIAALRQKALANKRNQIKTTEEDLMAVSLESRRTEGPSAVDLTKDATFKERVWRNRSTCLEAAS
uniref:Paf1 complex subunit Cdc73 N-terminal domain-containing protein n=1 Tax=Romanomermis culicivorax TaxID=13658 RepID=A0A915IPL3_ROMCU